MKFDWLEDLVVLSEEGSFSRTASRRNVAQPALSRRVKALENWVGAKLFDRNNHPITLTGEGRIFLPFAQDALGAVSIGRNKIRASTQNERQLKFSSTHTISILFFPEWFRSVQGTNESIGINLQANHLSSCVQDLASGDSQFMLCYSNGSDVLGFDEGAFEHKTVGHDKLIPVTKKMDTGKAKFSLPGEGRTLNPLLEYSQSSALGRMVEELLVTKREFRHIRRQSESPAADNLLALATQGLGIAWIPALRLTELENGGLARAGDDSWNVDVEIRIYKSNASLPNTAIKFWNQI